MTLKAMLAMAAITATIPTLLFTTALAGEPVGGASSIICDAQGNCEEHTTIICPARSFAWGGGGDGGGGECWSKGDSSRFASWLKRHGSSPRRFRVNYPELAAIFGRDFGIVKPDPFWRTCITGEACARAVIGHIFGGDISYEMRIVSCETGGTFSNRALGNAGERGLWQIHPVHFGSLDEDMLWDVRYNTRVAYRMSGGGRDFGPWTCA